MCEKNNIILIFDEICSGFRWHLKGAQYIYNVNPDLTTFGKAIANGYSASLLGGRKELMSLGNIELKENKTFFLSATHGAERCGLGAMIATIEFYKNNNVIEKLWKSGNKLISELNKIVKKHSLENYIEFGGAGCLPFYKITNGREFDPVLTKIFHYEMAKSNIIVRNLNICYRI